jgi:hypothetical protein
MKRKAVAQAPSSGHVARHMFVASTAFLPVGLAALLLGMGLYHWTEGLPWADAFLNAAMLLGGMGPVDPVKTTAGKILIGVYAMLAGLFVIILAGVMLSPVMHHILNRLHVDDES